MSTVATNGDTVTAAVIAVAASIATLVATFFHLFSGRVISVAIELDIDTRALIILAREKNLSACTVLTSTQAFEKSCNS